MINCYRGSQIVNRVLPLLCLGAGLLGQPAMAQPVIESFPSPQVQIQDPPGSGWRSVPREQLPAGARVVGREPLSHVIIEVSGRQVWVRERDVRLSSSGEALTACPPGKSRQPSQIAGQMGLGGGTECVPVRR